MKNFQQGQLILTIILIMTVALAIGLSVIQKGLVDVSTSTKTEQSSQAFSAAEAGIEQTLLKSPDPGVNSSPVPIGVSSFSVLDQGEFPKIPAPGQRQEAFELPALAKEDAAQVWLANPKDDPPGEYYIPDDHSIEVYWGDASTSLIDPAAPALSAKILYYDSTSGYQFMSSLKPFDPNTDRAAGNGFTPITSGSNGSCDGSYLIKTNLGNTRKFLCKWLISGLPARLMLIRFRMLYSTSNQPLAVWATGTCSSCRITPQARVIVSTGISGDAQRSVQVFKQEKIVPSYFDYAIFSAGEIKKTD